MRAIGVSVAIWCVVGAWATLRLVSIVTALRVDSDDAREGLDIALHGEALHQ
jgi:Amt family ammonium transporter